MSTETKHTPEPWSYQLTPGAGLQIKAPVHLTKAVTLPGGLPSEIEIYTVTPRSEPFLLASERWVQFSPEGWDAMQLANAERIVACVNAMHGVENPAALRVAHDQMLRSAVECPSCNGEKGFEDTTYNRTGEWTACTKCKGRGKIVDQSIFFAAAGWKEEA